MTAAAPMTATQHDTLAFVRAYAGEHGYMPTLQEIGDHFGISKVAAFERVNQLIDRRLVHRVRCARRGLALAENCPCCGKRLEV